MSITQVEQFAGRSQDAVVMGKSLRDWSIRDIGETTEALYAWKQAVANETGMTISEAVGASFAAEFEGHFGRIAISEHHVTLNQSFTKGAMLLGYANATVLDRIDVPGADDGLILHLAVITTEEGGRALIGVEDGEWGEYDAVDLEKAISDVKRQEHFLTRALSKLTSPDGFIFGAVTGQPEKVSEALLAEGLKRGQRWRPASWLADKASKDGWCEAGGRGGFLFIVHKNDQEAEIDREVYGDLGLGARHSILQYGDMWVRIS